MKVHWRHAHPLRLLEGGAELFPALVHALDAARHFVYFETYILHFAGAALPVVEALERCAWRGVVVRLLVDGVGCADFPLHWHERLERAGVLVRIFRPLGRWGWLLPSRWRRLHRKLCVVDGLLGFCGGINLIDDRDDLVLGRLAQPRLDFAVEVRGPVVADMLNTMEQLWWWRQTLDHVRERDFRMAWQIWRSGALPVSPRALHLPRHTPVVALLLRDNFKHRHAIEKAYLQAIARAKHEVLIANAYFIPGRRLRRALLLAALRGVRVRLLLHGRYEHFFQYHTARPAYDPLLKAGIEIYEYAPSALHAKVAVVDGSWATVGSTNLDPLSLLLAREANIVTDDHRFARVLQHRLQQLMLTAGQRVDHVQWQQRSWWQRRLDGLALWLMRCMLWLLGLRY